MNIEESPFQFLDNTPKIRVVIRKRPLGKKESQKNDSDIIDVKGPQTLAVRETKLKVDLTKYIEEHIFNFDRVFDENSTNQQIYLETVRPLVESCFNGAKVTCFAYGQTGSGKTFTMMGETAGDAKENYNSIPGLYILAAQDVFTLLEQPRFQHLAVYISFYEIYCTKLHDLLNDRQQLFAREDGKQKVNIVGLSEKRVVNVHSLMQIIDYGNSVRTTASTSANDDSSRSHAILQINVKSGNKIHGKMSFIDLAGSERGADVVETNKQTRMDGAEINKSLLALKECIRALDMDKKHTPFRGSKLTLVLKDSFTGNCKTVMIGNISPASSSCEHTLNTLRYADRVKELKKPSNDNNVPLSQADLLAQQLMLPRQAKNTVKMNLPTEDDSPNLPLLSGKNNPANKNSKSRYTMNGYPNTSSHQNDGYQNNQYQNQQYSNMNLASPDNLFNLQQGFQNPRSDSNLKDIMNLPKEGYNNLANKNQSKGQPNLYQPNLYQNTNISLNNQNEQPRSQFNLVSQLNVNRKKPMPTPESYLNTEPVAEKSDYNPKRSTGRQVRNKTINTSDGINGRNDMENYKPRGQESLESLNKKHEDLINVILAEEEEIISMHRQHIDDVVDLIKQEMVLLHEVDKPASDIDEYVQNLDSILNNKIETIAMLKNKLKQFKSHLKEEEVLSKKFHEQRNETMDIFDLNNGENIREGDLQLLDNLNHVI